VILNFWFGLTPSIETAPVTHGQRERLFRLSAQPARIDPDALTIDGNWEDDMKSWFHKEKPPGGWPK